MKSYMYPSIYSLTTATLKHTNWFCMKSFKSNIFYTSASAQFTSSSLSACCQVYSQEGQCFLTDDNTG